MPDLGTYESAFLGANSDIISSDEFSDILAQAAQSLLGAPVGKEHAPALAGLARREHAGAVCLALYAIAARAAGDDTASAAALRKALQKAPNHLHLQRLLRISEGVGDDPDLIARFCSAPFENFETEPGGAVHFCCPAWQPVPIGNLNDASPEEIWNSDAAREIRKSIHDGSYRYCSRTHCPKLSRQNLPMRQDLTNERLAGIARDRRTHLKKGPKKIVLSHDRSCNLSCPSCRSGLILARKEEQNTMNRMADAVLFPVIRDAERLRITASGDPFGSAHFQYVLRHLDRAGNAELKLDLQTNGLLLTPEVWERLKLEGKVSRLMVSADAAQPETYAIVRRGGQWETLCRNLDFFARLRINDKIKELRLDFVVQALNFREMPDFVHLARRLGCDGVKFQMIRNWGTMSREAFTRAEISDPSHPEYAQFLDVLRAPQLATPYVELWGMEQAVNRAHLADEPLSALLSTRYT